MRKLGADLRNARRRRRIPAAVIAERAFISIATLTRIERGEPTVACGAYVAVIHALGLIERVAGLADATVDGVGLMLEEERLPQRVRLRKSER
jgi:transcriptional regulator with XRE-family HTH domain